MTNVGTLVEALQDHYLNHGRYPKVTISRAFWEEHAGEVAKLAGDGIDIVVSDKLKIKSSFLLDDAASKSEIIQTLHDLKRQVDRLIRNGRGGWPVVYTPHDANVYLQIRLQPIIPGEAPCEGLELRPDFPDAPEAEHILMLVGR